MKMDPKGQAHYKRHRGRELEDKVFNKGPVRKERLHGWKGAACLHNGLGLHVQER